MLGTSIDISTDEIGIVTFKLNRRHRVASKNAITKTWRKTLDLLFDSIPHIY